ncbi:MAG: RsmB/NOP family class I SAM-dependent RNA methyltransferase [Alphaproteobacteria bacterium]|nr:RsmB/NOP family class I SAM-dependent RNA methyltransferase [Alphaproteobacteria bacterium]
MTPAARAQAAIELLRTISEADIPADAVTAAWFRARRYAGSGDRRWVLGLVFGALRRQGQLDWWTGRHGETPSDRSRVLAHLMLVEGWDAGALGAAFAGVRYGPSALLANEFRLVEGLAGAALDHPGQPDWVRGNVPHWLAASLAAGAGDPLTEFGALAMPAPVDLRVNTLKADRATARRALVEAGVACEPTPWSPVGLRLAGRQPLGQLAAFKDGLIEVQDESSQLAALLVDAGPDMAILDYCAGAGGKTLAIAAAMGGEGKIVAADVSVARLERIEPRLRRAAAHNVALQLLSGADDPWHAAHAGRFDRVLVDVPCTRTGTWRRDPALKWRLDAATLAASVATQRQILATTWQLVRPGGHLVYATCSLLPEENSDQMSWFRDAHPDVEIVPVAQPWRSAIGGICPSEGDDLTLTPARHGTDGFFVAIRRRGGGAP